LTNGNRLAGMPSDSGITGFSSRSNHGSDVIGKLTLELRPPSRVTPGRRWTVRPSVVGPAPAATGAGVTILAVVTLRPPLRQGERQGNDEHEHAEHHRGGGRDGANRSEAMRSGAGQMKRSHSRAVHVRFALMRLLPMASSSSLGL